MTELKALLSQLGWVFILVMGLSVFMAWLDSVHSVSAAF